MSETEERLKSLQENIRGLKKEKERFTQQKCGICNHFILYKAEIYGGKVGYCDAHDRNVRKEQARYPWCKFETKKV